MNAQLKPWIRLSAALTAIATAGLFWAGPALAQGHLRVSESDLPGGEADNGGDGFLHTTIEYLQNNTYINVGPHYLSYIGSSSNLTVHDPKGPGQAGFPDGAEIPNTGAGVGDKFFGGGTLGMYIPSTGHHLAVEVLLAAPLELTFETRGRAIDDSLLKNIELGGSKVPTGVQPIGKTVGTLMALPPNFTIVYRPWVDTLIQPYIGIGLAYLYTYDSDVTNDVLTQNGNEPTLYMSKPVACMAQVGVDISLPYNLYLNADARYMGCAEITAKLNDIEIPVPKQPALPNARFGTFSATVDFEALIYSLNIGWKF